MVMLKKKFKINICFNWTISLFQFHFIVDSVQKWNEMAKLKFSFSVQLYLLLSTNFVDVWTKLLTWSILLTKTIRINRIEKIKKKKKYTMDKQNIYGKTDDYQNNRVIRKGHPNDQANKPKKKFWYLKTFWMGNQDKQMIFSFFHIIHQNGHDLWQFHINQFSHSKMMLIMMIKKTIDQSIIIVINCH